MTATTSLLLVRVTVAGIIAVHGWARLFAGAVDPFGHWLDGLGFPFGHWIAWGITLFEIIATPVLAFGRLLLPLTLGFATIYAVGIALVHAKAGWFVVGLGRNGMEFSVLLIACLLAVGLQDPRLRRLRG
jgi:putative oxidoreductase